MLFFSGYSSNSKFSSLAISKTHLRPFKTKRHKCSNLETYNHAVFSNKMKLQQTGHLVLMSRATWKNNFLNQQAMLNATKSCAILISNYVRRGNTSDGKSLITVLFQDTDGSEASKNEQRKRREIKIDIHC